MSPSKIFFTADTHFRHANIIKYCNRPFSCIKDHDEALIRNWNGVVTNEDDIFHLGDFMFGYERDIGHLLGRLNFKNIYFVSGNHDKALKEFFYKRCDLGDDNITLYDARGTRKMFLWDSYAEINLNSQTATLCHYAMRVFNKSHHGAWQLYGHSHGSLPDDPNALSIDVGVDCHNYAPISLERVREIMSKKKFKAIDHHTGSRP